MTGNAWEDLCVQCYRIRYQSDHYTAIPAAHQGDAGIEGYTCNGIVHQCYSPEREYSDDDLYKHYRKKMTDDLGKMMSVKDTIGQIKNYIVAKGFSYTDGLIENFYLSLKSKPFVILEEKGASVQYEYVFEAKYRINPALPGSDYYETISHRPGPEVGDINTMHRYRDAIVYRNGANPFERTMFGAYVLFPYGNEDEYRNHRFYQSIDKVNIGGLPFLPSATKMVTEMLDELISDSPESAFERATLPRGIEEKLARTDLFWLAL